MFPALVLALLASSPPTSPAAASSEPRWETFAANPAYEVYGREDANGVFRYLASRLKVQGGATTSLTPTLNFGVNLSPTAAPTESVMGTDAEAARLVLTKPAESQPVAKAAPPVCGHSDCDGGRCNRRPRPPDRLPQRLPELRLPELRPVHLAFVLGGLLLAFVVVVVFIAACVLFGRVLFYLFTSGARNDPQ